MINFMTCFKCWSGTATLTYEESRIYKVSCKCGCEYTFEHCSMKAAQEYHNKMLELHGEIDRNAKLKAENERLKESEKELFNLQYVKALSVGQAAELERHKLLLFLTVRTKVMTIGLEKGKSEIEINSMALETVDEMLKMMDVEKDRAIYEAAKKAWMLGIGIGRMPRKIKRQ